MIGTDSFKIKRVQKISLVDKNFKACRRTTVELSPNSRIMYVGLIDNVSKRYIEREPKIAVLGTRKFQLISKADLTN